MNDFKQLIFHRYRYFQTIKRKRVSLFVLFSLILVIIGTAQDHTLLDPGIYHQYRAGLKNSQIKFEQEKVGRVAFLGGSITYNPGWRDSVMHYLEVRFPNTQFEFIAAGIPSMGTTPAAFRLQRDVLDRGPVDLLFEEAAVNDATNGRSSQEQIRAMEGIVRHVRRMNPSSDMIMMHFVDPAKMESYRADSIPVVIQNHELVAQHYGIPSINLAREVTDRIDHGEFSWEADFKDLHPSPFGQGVYARSIIHLLEHSYRNALSKADIPARDPMPEPIDKYHYGYGTLVDVRESTFDGGWMHDPNWIPQDSTGTRENYTHVPMLVSTEYGQSLTFEFEGKAVGIAVASGYDAGTIQYRIDTGEWMTLNLKTRWSDYLHLPWYYTLASELTTGAHVLELQLMPPMEGSQAACRIRYFYVNE